LVGEFYSDVQPSLDSWHRRGYKLCVYSSGSVHAQKNLFSHPKGHSSMLHYISDHFDTTIGGKREAESYTKIAKHIAMEPRSIMFLTDIFEEAVAADAAGFQVTLLVRPGNAPLPDTHTFATAQSFVDLQL
jgi:methylthioribulose 1-phosphate dehydratase/enolase-phosphatase E1